MLKGLISDLASKQETFTHIGNSDHETRSSLVVWHDRMLAELHCLASFLWSSHLQKKWASLSKFGFLLWHVVNILCNCEEVTCDRGGLMAKWVMIVITVTKNPNWTVILNKISFTTSDYLRQECARDEDLHHHSDDQLKDEQHDGERTLLSDAPETVANCGLRLQRKEESPRQGLHLHHARSMVGGRVELCRKSRRSCIWACKQITGTFCPFLYKVWLYSHESFFLVHVHVFISKNMTFCIGCKPEDTEFKRKSSQMFNFLYLLVLEMR